MAKVAVATGKLGEVVVEPVREPQLEMLEVRRVPQENCQPIHGEVKPNRVHDDNLAGASAGPLDESLEGARARGSAEILWEDEETP